MPETLPFPEYPRPQLRREEWLNLNGRWQYAITPHPTNGVDPLSPRFVAPPVAPPAWDGEILVPYSPEATLSGVQRTVHRSESLFYRRTFALPRPLVSGERVLLHFGAVDQACRVAVNGRELGENLGGYLPFTFDITAALDAGGSDHELLVAVRDVTDESWLTRGKQRNKRGGIWYTPQSGIWQTVWLEIVPETFISSLTLTPDIDSGSLAVTVHTGGSPSTEPAEVEIFEGETSVGRATLTPGESTAVSIDAPLRLWSPADPFLYDVRVRLGADRVESYAGMRSTGTNGTHLLLNGEPIFPIGLLDQGYWPEGLYTPPSDAALEWDVRFAKERGFTMLRKHIKIEPLRWYYHCDRLGMLVWQDAVNGGEGYSPMTVTAPVLGWPHRSDTGDRRGFGRANAEGRAHFEAELLNMITHLHNSPSIVLWVPFNEGWGQFDAARIAEAVQAHDPSRPVDHASGWHDQGAGDLQSLHVYFRRFRAPRPDHRVLALTEYGGYSYAVPGHAWGSKKFGYRRYQTAASLTSAYSRLHLQELLPLISRGLGALVYTQLSDVEDEDNGLVTYDRTVEKIPAANLRAINRALQAAFSAVIAAGGKAGSQ